MYMTYCIKHGPSLLALPDSEECCVCEVEKLRAERDGWKAKYEAAEAMARGNMKAYRHLLQQVEVFEGDNLVRVFER